jgi:release factor glutamine methyltransferase
MEVVRLSTGYLNSHGSASPRLDAELLAARALDIGRLDIYLQFDRPLEEHQLEAIRALVRRRAGGEPIAHITGEREFYGRGFAVTPEVLIPRPETETLVTLALAEARARATDGEGLRLLDVGTGSGCIAVTLALELPGARLVASDVSAAALEVARQNAARHGVVGRIELLLGSWCAPVAGRCFDLVVANPPYIPSEELAGLAPDVRDHEPGQALDGGADGMTAYRGLLPSVAPILAPGGWVGLEIDIRGADRVTALGIQALGPVRAQTHPDLSGRPRVVTFHG